MSWTQNTKFHISDGFLLIRPDSSWEPAHPPWWLTTWALRGSQTEHQRRRLWRFSLCKRSSWILTTWTASDWGDGGDVADRWANNGKSKAGRGITKQRTMPVILTISLFLILFTGALIQPVEKNLPVFPYAYGSLLCGYCRSVALGAKCGGWSLLFSSGLIIIRLFDIFWKKTKTNKNAEWGFERDYEGVDLMFFCLFLL